VVFIGSQGAAELVLTKTKFLKAKFFMVILKHEKDLPNLLRLGYRVEREASGAVSESEVQRRNC
jgi:hypothetical protein